MTSHQIQAHIIKTYLKPTLKAHGYKTSGKTWWRDCGEFFVVINLQNSQWNTKEELSFCLNIGVALTARLADTGKKKATQYDLATHLREDYYLSKERLQAHKEHGGWLGYRITDRTDINEFINEFKIDLESFILPKLSELKTLKDCVEFYDKIDFWGDSLRRQIDESRLEIK